MIKPKPINSFGLIGINFPMAVFFSLVFQTFFPLVIKTCFSSVFSHYFFCYRTWYRSYERLLQVFPIFACDTPGFFQVNHILTENLFLLYVIRAKLSA